MALLESFSAANGWTYEVLQDLLGYTPLGSLLPPGVMHTLPAAACARLLAPRFFASLIAAYASLLRGQHRLPEVGPNGAQPDPTGGPAQPGSR